tara:strand:+ start:340 stop:600 length:261 start_codon:yes stop_codon:yes gene_type:complete
MATIIDAILAINPNAEVSLDDANDINSITWLKGEKISKADIEAKQAELQIIDNDKPTRDELKTSAKQKLMNGEALTEDEANVMVGL